MSGADPALSAFVKVEIWSDVVCPWCAVGRRRFETALAGFAHRDDVQVRWRSFELDPDAPEERGKDWVQFVADKYGTSRESAQRNADDITAAGAEEGLTFRFDLARDGNTFDAHRLIHLAWDRGGFALQDAVKARLMRGSFTDGEAVGNHETLVRLVSEAGLDADEAREVLASDRYADEVRGDEALARRYGISGVPFFVIDDKYGISGAQPSAVLAEALETAWTESHPLTAFTPSAAASGSGTGSADDEGSAADAGEGGDACADGSCAVRV